MGYGSYENTGDETMGGKRKLVKLIIRRTLLGLVVVLVLIQFIPYGRDHASPPVVLEPVWDSPATRELFFRSCGDCHSNETSWPWYSNIAPVSWLVQKDVDEGREEFNVSEWNRKENEGDEAAEEVREGEMPLFIYTLTHPEARLSDADREALTRGLVATFGDEGEHDDHDDDDD
jgi:mono/diheme cytochrome c family protein